MLRRGSEIAGQRIGPVEIFNLAGGRKGIPVNVESYRKSSLIITVQSTAYQFVGQLIRETGGSLIFSLDSVTVDRSLRGQGVGRNAFAKQVEQSRRLGVDRIKLKAARNDDPEYIQVGYKVWPKFGFDADLDARRLKEHPLPDSLRSAKKVSDLYATEEGREWWEKNGWSTNMLFDMTADSLSWNIWRNYVTRKAAGLP